MTDAPPLHLAVAPDGSDWQPAAWRESDASPDQLFTAAYWSGLAAEAEHGLLDFRMEPFPISKAIALVDYVSQGRAGWRAQLVVEQA